jgi:ParB-like chromosome segregation protein Spo0J
MPPSDVTKPATALTVNGLQDFEQLGSRLDSTHTPKHSNPQPDPMRVWSKDVGHIDVGPRLRALDHKAVARLADSFLRVGQLQPISLWSGPDDCDCILIAGLHRLEAAKLIGWQYIDAVWVSGDDVERELGEIAENLHRAEMTALERDIQVARWIELTVMKQAEVSSQPETKPHQGGRPAGGVNAASRELSISKPDAHRAVKVASISPEAKQAAVNAGIDDNRTALIAVAKETTPEAQVAKVAEIAGAKANPKTNSVSERPPRKVSKIAQDRVDGCVGSIEGLLGGLEKAKPETVSLIVQEIADNENTRNNVKALRDQLNRLLRLSTEINSNATVANGSGA